MPTQFDDAFIEIRVDKSQAEDALDEIDRGRGPGETSRRRRDGRSREQRERDKRRRESRKENKKLLRLGKRAGRFLVGGAAGAGTVALIGQMILPVVRKAIEDELIPTLTPTAIAPNFGPGHRPPLITLTTVKQVIESALFKSIIATLEGAITAGLNDLSDTLSNVVAGVEEIQQSRQLALLDPDSLSVESSIDAFDQTRKYKKFQNRLSLYNSRESIRVQTAVFMRMFGVGKHAQQ